MTGKSYVIRGYHFGYNDEYLYVCGSAIRSVHQDKSVAEKIYRSLTIECVRSAELSEESSVFDASEEFINKLDAFVFDKTGVHIASYGCIEPGVQLPAKLSDDDVLAFAKLAEMSSYQLVEFDSEPVFNAIWNCKEQSYQMDYDECYEGMVYSSSQQETMGDLARLMEYNDWGDVKIKGNINDISDQPTILRALIDSNKCFSFKEGKQHLKLSKTKPEQFAALNELLKKPFFEIRKLTAQQIMEMEEGMGYEY